MATCHTDVGADNKDNIGDNEDTKYDDRSDKEDEDEDEEEADDVNLLRAPPISACSISSWESKLTNLHNGNHCNPCFFALAFSVKNL